jgi:hypothetical protein
VRKRSDRAVALPESSGELVPRRRGTRWPWLIVLIAVGAVKVQAYASLLHHRGGMIAALAIGLALSMLRSKLVAIAGFAAGILAFALALHPSLIGVGFGVGAFVLLVTVFFAISTVLHARQRRVVRGRRA